MRAAIAPLLLLALATGCGSDDPGPGPSGQAGSACTSAAQCYSGLAEASAVQGTVQCLDKIGGGYCTHTCAADSDCCAVPGECPRAALQVCAPFENQPDQYCLLSCEDADIAKAGFTDATDFCHRYASAAFGCRSTGGGANNRKICAP